MTRLLTILGLKPTIACRAYVAGTQSPPPPLATHTHVHTSSERWMAWIRFPFLGQHPGAQQLGNPEGGRRVSRDGGVRGPGTRGWKRSQKEFFSATYYRNGQIHLSEKNLIWWIMSCQVKKTAYLAASYPEIHLNPGMDIWNKHFVFIPWDGNML